MKTKSQLQTQDRRRKLAVYAGKTLAKRLVFANLYGQVNDSGDCVIYPYSQKGVKTKLLKWQADAIAQCCDLWRIHCLVLCRDATGKPYTKGFVVKLESPAKQHELNKHLSHMHYDFMRKECNTNHVLTLGWIATLSDSITDELCAKIMEDLGAWSDFDYCISNGDGTFTTNPINKDCK